MIESDLEVRFKVFIYSIDSFRDRNFLANNGKIVISKKLLVTYSVVYTCSLSPIKVNTEALFVLQKITI